MDSASEADTSLNASLTQAGPAVDPSSEITKDWQIPYAELKEWVR